DRAESKKPTKQLNILAICSPQLFESLCSKMLESVNQRQVDGDYRGERYEQEGCGDRGKKSHPRAPAVRFPHPHPQAVRGGEDCQTNDNPRPQGNAEPCERRQVKLDSMQPDH